MTTPMTEAQNNLTTAAPHAAVDTASSPTSVVSFDHFDNFRGWYKSEEFLISLLEAYGARSVLEIGSGANPTLDIGGVTAKDLTYTTNDIDQSELEKAPEGYEKLCLDLCAGDISKIPERYDLIFSRMVNEHIANGEKYYANLFELLNPGGITAHCFSTLYALPFLANRLMPEWISDQLLNFANPRNRDTHDKFKAYYSWSRGPSKRMLRRFEGLGYRVLRYTGYFGHNYYQKRLPLLDGIEQFKARTLAKRMPLACMTSYATIVLQKP